MTYNQIIRRLKYIATSHKQIRAFRKGLVQDFLTDKTLKYAAVFLQDNNGIISSSTHQATFNFRIFFIDLVHVSEDTKTNEDDVISDMISVALDFFAQASYGTYSDWKLSATDNFQIVTEYDNDMLAGVYVDFSVSVIYSQNVCQVPSQIDYNEEDKIAKEVKVCNCSFSRGVYNAISWVKDMQKSLPNDTEGWGIWLDEITRVYLNNVVLKGRISIQGFNYTNPSIYLSTPSNGVYTENYFGPFEGNIVYMSAADKEVRLYFFTDAEYYIDSFPVDPSTGAFSIPLQTAIQPGAFILKVWDTVNDIQAGITTAPGMDNLGLITDMQVEAYVRHDTIYTINVNPAYASGKYSIFGFILPNPEEDVVYTRLVRISTGEVLADTRYLGRTSRSFKYPDDAPGVTTARRETTFIYDTALALLGMTAWGETEYCERVIQATLDAQFPYEDGGYNAWPFAHNFFYPYYTINDKFFRTGAEAWLVYGLAYWAHYSASDPDLLANVLSSIQRFITYMEWQKHTFDNGLTAYRGGNGENDPGGGGTIPTPILWVSTEHHIDIWFMSREIQRLNYDLKFLSDTELASVVEMQQIAANYLINWAWLPSKNYMSIGTDDDGIIKENEDALDCQSWGSLFYYAWMRDNNSFIYANRVRSMLERCETVYRTQDTVSTSAPNAKGYTFYENTPPVVWWEGSFGVALAYLSAGSNDSFQQIMDDLFKYQQDDGSFLYASQAIPDLDVLGYPSMASTCWYLICSAPQQNIFI